MLHDITGLVPRNKKPTRKGRGKAAGKGKTAGRGTKGSGAHGGDVHWKPGHEGGQTPLFRRWPKRGFSNFKFERKFNVVNLDALEQFDNGATVDAAALIALGSVPDAKLPLKVLGDGTLTKKLTVIAGAYSKTALEKIKAVGGVAQTVKGEAYVTRKEKPAVDPAKAWERKQQQKNSSGKKAAPAAAAEAPAAEAPKAE
ncbi:50S ribosomal protein L15 [Humisphaera borealis]|uniref:Large ribosomal subunit protein uL15 n=1 Tax=Humisphaera borealis TaxID=2807512 RepID=A0A7M2X6L1_9BACT|nr:50S ribosomal protein L15 [Humisphaera borealis]